MSEQRFVVPFSRSHKCNEIGEQDIGTEVRLMGWVGRVRNLGGLRFIDLRDTLYLRKNTVCLRHNEMSRKVGVCSLACIGGTGNDRS